MYNKKMSSKYNINNWTYYKVTVSALHFPLFMVNSPKLVRWESIQYTNPYKNRDLCFPFVHKRTVQAEKLLCRARVEENLDEEDNKTWHTAVILQWYWCSFTDSLHSDQAEKRLMCVLAAAALPRDVVCSVSLFTSSGSRLSGAGVLLGYVCKHRQPSVYPSWNTVYRCELRRGLVVRMLYAVDLCCRTPIVVLQ